MTSQGSESVVRDRRVGQAIGDRYRLEAVIGRGGQSIVYRARDCREGDLVAVKVLSDAVTRDPISRERMFREAQAMASLIGTSAVRVLDQVWTPDGALALVMELLVGVELEDGLERLEANGKRLPARDLVQLFEPVVSTLETAHAQGIVHRDLKPANIFVLDDGRVRLLDFGFAKFTRLPGVTAAGSAAGSPTYMAPEAWLGDPLKLDHRLDVYALGAVIFRALAGEPPFVNAWLGELMVAVTKNARPSLLAKRPDLPGEIDAWVEKALAIQPSDRYPDVRKLWVGLKGALRI